LDNTNDKIKFLQEIAKVLVSIESQIELEIQIDSISRNYGISKEAVYAEINKIKYVNKNKEIQAETKVKPVIKRKNETTVDESIIRRENVIIYLLINGNEINRKKIKENIQLEDFKYSLNKEILQKIYEAIDSNKSITNIVDSMEEKELISQCTKIMADDYEISDIDKCIEDMINSYTKERLIRKKKRNIIKARSKYRYKRGNN